MVFVYYAQGVSGFFKDFIERLMSELALRGTEITNQSVKLESAEMDVKYIDERGHMFATVEGENIKVTYQVLRERKEVKKGLMGAITGAGVGGFLGSVLRRDSNIGDRVVDAVSGAAAGGAYEAYEGYEESKESRTEFAAELAEAINKVEDQLQYVLEGQRAAKESVRESVREKTQKETERKEELLLQLEDLYAEIITIKEEIELAESEGKKLESVKARIMRAEKLYEEARESANDGDYAVAKAKMKAAENMVERARENIE
ncbi:hypothetical protein KEJ47_06975 [Candidatus Bathyarchaeota archaeon]|nr:hypothetical protein [Candidatus Bathyarchaeota archaeon]